MKEDCGGEKGSTGLFSPLVHGKWLLSAAQHYGPECPHSTIAQRLMI